MIINAKKLILTTGIAALSLMSPKQASAQSNDDNKMPLTGILAWYEAQEKTQQNGQKSNQKSDHEWGNQNVRYARGKTYNSAFSGNKSNDALIKSANPGKKDLARVSSTIKMNKEDINFGYNKTEYDFFKYKMLCISKGAQMTPGAEQRIVNYLSTDTLTYQKLMDEFFLVNEFVWRQRLRVGDTVDVLSHKDMLPGTIKWRPNVKGQNAFRVIITDENRILIAEEVHDDIRYTGMGPIKYECYFSNLMGFKLNGAIIFAILTKSGQKLAYKLRMLDLIREQQGIMGKAIQSDPKMR